jgi:hypothetical protein
MDPLQLGGILNGLIGLLAFLIFLAVAVAVGLFVYRDAAANRVEPGSPLPWAIGVVLGFWLGLVPGLVVLAVYLYVR